MQLELVEWHDAGNLMYQWTDRDVAREELEEDEGLVIKSAGFLIAETPHYLCLVQNWNITQDDVSDVIRIPKGMVIKRTLLG